MEVQNTPQYSQSPAPITPAPDYKKWLWLLVPAAVILVLFYFGLFERGDSSKLYLTLAPLNSGDVSIYTYDFKTGDLQKTPLKGRSLTPSLSPDGKRIAYAGTVGDGGTDIFITDLNLSEPFRVTSEPKIIFKRLPQWLSDGKAILFNGQEDGVGNFATPEDWGVYMTDLLGSTIKVTNGLQPLVSPLVGHFLILKNDGIYLHALGVKEGKKVWGAENARVSMKLALSKDGRTLAWSSPNEGKILIFDIASWQPFSMRKISEISTNSFWVAFSPDGRYLAAQEVDWENINTDPKPRIVTFDLQDQNKKNFVVDLSDFNQQAMFLTDWR